MPTSTRRDVEVLDSAYNTGPDTAAYSLDFPANDTVNVASARLPSMRIPFRVAGMRFARRRAGMGRAADRYRDRILGHGAGLIATLSLHERHDSDSGEEA